MRTGNKVKTGKVNKIGAILAAAALLVLAAGCGSSTKVITAEDKTAENSGMDEVSSAQEQVRGEEGAQQGESGQEKGYIFEYEGLQLTPDMDAAAALDSLGEPKSYFEAESCAFHGLDKIFTYPSFEIDTYPTEEKDYISNIILKDDTVATREGVSLYMSKEDMIAAYGEGFVEESGVCSYEKGGMKLCFIYSGDEIHSIEYRSKVLENG